MSGRQRTKRFTALNPNVKIFNGPWQNTQRIQTASAEIITVIQCPYCFMPTQEAGNADALVMECPHCDEVYKVKVS